MPRYFFDTLDGQNCIDEDGEMLADDEAAQSAAGFIASELTPSRIAHIWAGDTFRVVVRDRDTVEIGHIVITATIVSGGDVREGPSLKSRLTQ